MRPFQPAGTTTTVSATTTSSATARPEWIGSPQLQIVNAGGDTVHVAWGVAARLPSGTLTATTSDYPVLPGATVVVSKGEANVVAVRANAATATVYLTAGDGA